MIVHPDHGPLLDADDIYQQASGRTDMAGALAFWRAQTETPA
jgi:hypothetical protein